MKKSDILVAIIMGSKSDWPTMKKTALMLDKLKIKYETKIVSAHRTPDLLYDFASSADMKGIEVIIAGAGGSAHLPGMTASKTHLPVIGVPIKTKNFEWIRLFIVNSTNAQRNTCCCSSYWRQRCYQLSITSCKHIKLKVSKN